MTQVPGPSQRPVDAPVVPGDASTPDSWAEASTTVATARQDVDPYELLTRALKLAGDAASLTQHGPRYWTRITGQLLADTDLLDALVAYRQVQQLAEHARKGGLSARLREASIAVRKFEHHWPADCLAEAADVIDRTSNRLHALQMLATEWAMQATDYDEDTEQQIQDGWTVLALLDAPMPHTRDRGALEAAGLEAMTEWRDTKGESNAE